MSSAMAIGQTSSISEIFQDILPGAEYFRAAKSQAIKLSIGLLSSFRSMVAYATEIKPVFYAAANASSARMNDTTHIRKGGQAPFPQGPGYENNAKVIGMMRRNHAAPAVK